MKYLIFFFTTLAFSQAPVPIDHSGEKATLEIVTVDSFGKSLGTANVTLSRLNTGAADPAALVIPAKTEVAHGTYRIAATASGFEPASQIITVEDSRATAIIALVPGVPEEAGGGPVLEGTISDRSRFSRCSWIRFVPLFAALPPKDTFVYRGQFVLNGMKPGRYVSVLLGPSGVCHVSEATVMLGEKQSIVIQ